MFILLNAKVFTPDVFLMKGDDGIDVTGSNVCQVDAMSRSTCWPGIPARAERSQFFTKLE